MSEEKIIFQERLEFLGSNYKNASGRSDKFYECFVTVYRGRCIVQRRWGRFGAKGQSKEERYYSEYTALEKARELLAKKREKGYTSPVAPLKRIASVLDD